jgi:hypothetical protein
MPLSIQLWNDGLAFERLQAAAYLFYGVPLQTLPVT